MFVDKVQTALNEQINMELQAHYTYLAAADYFEGMGLKGFSQWISNHAEEEMAHAMKIYRYIHSRRGRVELYPVPAPEQDFGSPQAVMEGTLKQEQKVTESIDRIVKLARQEGDYATDSFLQWFVDEQVEEEELVDDLVQKLRLIGDFKPGLYLLDRELAGVDVLDETEE
ncbi:MAG: ferritin [Caldilineaceae bacterium]|nr:ferritin [Caldilineaceae bacterium]MCY4118616.1 ferritin [Caldilineaceae bacterium]